jgi:hypothetical protein
MIIDMRGKVHKRYNSDSPNEFMFYYNPFLSNLPKQQAIMDLCWWKLIS